MICKYSTLFEKKKIKYLVSYPAIILFGHDNRNTKLKKRGMNSYNVYITYYINK